MVERRPLLTVLTHAVLILGVLVVAFPLYLTFVASTHTTPDLMQSPMPLLPGDQLIPNYTRALVGSHTQGGNNPPVAPMMAVSLISALVRLTSIMRATGAFDPAPAPVPFQASR